MIKAVVTDIEGTTSDIRFVHQVLFPYARQRLVEYLRRHAHKPETAAALDELRRELARPKADLAELCRALFDFMNEDRKSTALKALQGQIWREGYRAGDFQGHVYTDVAPCLRQWRRQGLALYVYSSGSTEAQQLLFGHSESGDLRPLFSGYFDTRAGAKQQETSYRNIAGQVRLSPADILFLSDSEQELDAARAAGWRTCQLIRDKTVSSGRHPWVRQFNQIDTGDDTR
ncbi:acireductone synthase [Martelella alba]|uniref:Enolase-phosphatase E1 n=1 Tax=Martelella alba TaxID=2590451 RepID=A0ABY2SHQ5_9HYPH|nr:acireductone synthase [Martelella alba]TKI04878.1 acireductone synthase [Martelella alba]